jgi:hypothetical protein
VAFRCCLFLPAGLALACTILFGMRSLAGILFGQYLIGLGVMGCS